MGSWKTLVLALAMLAIFKVTSAQDITAEYACQPLNAADNVGNIYIRLTPTGTETEPAIILTKIELLTDAFIACGEEVTISVGGDAGVYEATIAVAINLDAASDPAIQCGITYTSASGNYQLNFATSSLTQGYHATKDKRFQINCPSFTAIAGELDTSSSFLVTDVLDDGTSKSRTPNGLTMEIQSNGGGTFVDTAGGVVVITSKLNVVVILDTTVSTPVADVRVTKVTFAQSLSGDDKTATIGDLTSGNVCPTTDGVVLGLVATTPVFTYTTGVSSITARSEDFDVLTLFSIADVAASGNANRPPMTATVEYVVCGAGGSCRPETETCSVAARKRRNVEEEEETDVNKGKLYATFLVSSNPRAQTEAQTGDSACEPLSNMGYLIGMIVLAALLVFSVAVTVFMFSRMNRPRTEYPKA